MDDSRDGRIDEIGITAVKTLVYLGPSGIGDWMFILPSLPALLHASGCDHVVAILPRRNDANGILRRSPLIHRIEYLDRPDRWWQLPAYLLRLPLLAWRVRRLHGKALAVSYLSNQPDTLLLARLSGVSRRIGLCWQGTLLERLAFNAPVDAAGAQGKVALHAMFAGRDANTSPAPVSLLQSTPADESRSLRERHSIPEQYVALGIGGGRNARWRFWPAENFSSLIASLPNVHFVLLGGGADDRAAADAILRTPLGNVSDLVNRVTFTESLQVLEGASACVGNDSGLANLAAAHGIPTLCLYGPTDPRLTGPALLGATPLNVSVPCGPCFGEDQAPAVALRCAHHQCLHDLSAQHVRDALAKLLFTRTQREP